MASCIRLTAKEPAFVKLPDQRKRLLVDGQHPASMPACQEGMESVIRRVVMKRATNRPKDRLDIEALEKIKRGDDPNV